jgi:hypothetical protein
MPNPLLRSDTWVVVHDPMDDTLRLSPLALLLQAPIDLLVFPGGGFTTTRAVWRFRQSYAVLRIECAGIA